ncbi:Prophage PSPPH06 head completion/stabilization protein, partial [Pseudomonas syringae pv. papulans]
FATVNRRESAENVGKELPERSETFLAFSQAAVRSLQGRGRITAALL